jgi:regulator of sigma E protease
VAKDAVYTNQGQPLGVAIQQGVSDAWGVLRSTVDVPLNLIKGTLNIQDARPASVVGISQMGAQVIQDSLDAKQSYPIWRFAAIISIAIGITQLLPIPGLDGGRILFVLIELLRGKPMKPEREGMIHLVGLMLLLGFMLIFVVNDLFNPINLSR